MDSCAGDGGQGDGNRPGDAHPSDANRGDAVAEVATSCLGAPIVAQSGTDNTPNDPQVVASGAQPVAIFGPPDGMGGYREPSGFFRVTGYPPNAPMLVQIIMAPCSTTNCAPDISFALGAADAGNVTIVGSTNQSCGSKVVSTDTSGSISISVGKSGDAGQEGGIGIVISPVPPDSGGPADATSD